MLVQERLEVELLWKDVVQLPQSAHDGAALVAPRAKVTVHQRVVYGDLDLTQGCKWVQKLDILVELSDFGQFYNRNSTQPH